MFVLMTQGPRSLGSKLVLLLFFTSVRNTPNAVVPSLLKTFIFWGGGGGTKREEGPVWFSQRRQGWLQLIVIFGCDAGGGSLTPELWTRESGLLEQPRRRGGEDRGPRDKAWLPACALRRGSRMAGGRPGARTPTPLLPGRAGWAEASTQGYSPAYAWACLPGSWLCRALRPASHLSHSPRRLSERSCQAPSCPTPCSPAVRHPGRESCWRAPRSGSTRGGCERRGYRDALQAASSQPLPIPKEEDGEPIGSEGAGKTSLRTPRPTLGRAEKLLFPVFSAKVHQKGRSCLSWGFSSHLPCCHFGPFSFLGIPAGALPPLAPVVELSGQKQNTG